MIELPLDDYRPACCRRLFADDHNDGQDSSGEIEFEQSLLLRERESLREACEKYNFDFDAEIPISNGNSNNFQWSTLSPGEVPEFYFRHPPQKPCASSALSSLQCPATPVKKASHVPAAISLKRQHENSSACDELNPETGPPKLKRERSGDETPLKTGRKAEQPPQTETDAITHNHSVTGDFQASVLDVLF